MGLQLLNSEMFRLPCKFDRLLTLLKQQPLTQPWPGLQLCPQAPQFAELVSKLTHAPPQQLCPGAHALPHVPQL